MEYSNVDSGGDGRKSQVYGGPDNVRTSKPSLRSIIQQEGLQIQPGVQYGQYLGPWQGPNSIKMRQTDCPLSKEDSNNNLKHKNVLDVNLSFPVARNTDIQHLPKVSMERDKDITKDGMREISELKSIDRSMHEIQMKKRQLGTSGDFREHTESMRDDVCEMSSKGKVLPVSGSRHVRKLREKVFDETAIKSQRRSDFVCGNEQLNRGKVADLASAAFCAKSASFEYSSADYYETSGDENTQFSVLTQSPQSSDNERIENVKSSEVGKLNDCIPDSKMPKGCFVRQIKDELNNDCDNEEIPVNEIMETESKKVKAVMRSGHLSREDLETGNGARSSQPRFPFSSFPPPYRGGPLRPRSPPFPHTKQWPMDPRFFTMPMPPPPMQWSPPSSPYQMYGPGSSYGTSQTWEPPTRPAHNEPVMNHKMHRQGNAKSSSGIPPPFPPYYSVQERDSFKDFTKNCPVEERNKPGMRQKARPSKGLVQYDSSEGSSSEIEPFDVDSLRDSDEETTPQVNQMKPTPKKLKTDTTDDDLSSAESYEKENRGKIHSNATAAFKIARGHSKKLRQKTLKSFSSTERQHIYPKARENTPKNMVQDDLRKKTLAGIIAESSRAGKTEGRLASSSTDSVSHGFRQLDSEQEKQLPPLPPLPPFPNSPFWSMYSPANNSALTGNSKEEDYPKKEQESSPVLQMQRKWLPKNPSQRYTFSPGQAGVNSPSETDSETRSIKSDWITNFKMFHDFGVKYIDTHCHLDFLFSREGFKGSFKAYMDKHVETFPDMFEGCVAVFCNPNSFTPSGGLWLDVAKEPNVWIAMGCHPKMATDFTAMAESGLKKCLHHSKCIALGEIGLDYSGTFHQHAEVQKQVFRRQLKIALQLEKALVIHCRQAEDDCLEIMKELVPRNWKIHCHCFTNEYKNAKLWIDAFPNLYIGVTPLVTYRTARPSHNLARNIPINKLLLETDAPYFVPRCIPKEDLQFSNPGLAITVAKEIAQYQELPVAAVLRQCRLNTKFMYGI